MCRSPKDYGRGEMHSAEPPCMEREMLNTAGNTSVKRCSQWCACRETARFSVFYSAKHDVGVDVFGDDVAFVGPVAGIDFIQKGLAARCSGDRTKMILNNSLCVNHTVKSSELRYPSTRPIEETSIKSEFSTGFGRVNETRTRQPRRPPDVRSRKNRAARCSYMELDRPGILHASKEAARRMSSPSPLDTERVERMAKYLNGEARRMVQVFDWKSSDRDT